MKKIMIWPHLHIITIIYLLSILKCIKVKLIKIEQVYILNTQAHFQKIFIWIIHLYTNHIYLNVNFYTRLDYVFIRD